MPDITDEKKEQIRMIAEKYSIILSKIPFEEGVNIYSKTCQALYLQSARWRFCLLCGKIDYPEYFRKNDHKCSHLSSQDLPILVKTSWVKLEEFFLSQKFLNILKEGGVIIEERK